MKKYLTEIHCHTKNVSGCGHVMAEEIVDLYVKAGYHSLVITDHINGDTQGRLIDGYEWEESVNLVIQGYEKAKAYADGKINILLGVEFNFDGDTNDYLTYGVTREFLLKCDGVRKWGIEKFMMAAKENGLIVFQAHPFRNNMTIKDPHTCDGIEIHNGHPRHDSRNDVAELWAKKYGLRGIGGSDFHEKSDVATSGIMTDVEITSNAQLVEILRSGNFEIIRKQVK